MVRLPAEERSAETSIDDLIITTPAGTHVALREIAKIDRGRAFTSINRREGRRVVQVLASVTPRAKAGEIIADLKENVLPDLRRRYPGLQAGFEGRRAEMAESLASLQVTFGLAMLVVYALLAIPFRSYMQPLIVMIGIPFGIVGAILGHLLMGFDLVIPSLFGIVALSGVVVNDSLVMIDFANRRRREDGLSPLEAILASGVQRFRPILLTTLTTFGGLAPMIFETSRQARFLIPMALSLGYGILFATFITLLLVPALYLVVEDVKLGARRTHRNRASLTASRFVPNPYARVPGERMYRSGDLARRSPDGDIEYLGRIDDQVKVRGFRIELGEIESTFTALPEVQAAVVVAHTSRAGYARLTGYVVLKDDAVRDAEALRRAVQNALPDYMVPAAIVFLDRIPRTRNGKVDRRALPAPKHHVDERTFVEPTGELEKLVGTLFCEILEIERIGARDDFFEAGGHSLLATRLVARLRRDHEASLTLRHFFDRPTVAGLAQTLTRLSAARKAEQSEKPRVPEKVAPVDRSRPLELSFAQQRLWFLAQLEPNSAAYNMPMVRRLKGPLDVGALERSLAELSLRHEPLRTTFEMRDGRPCQIVGRQAMLDLTIRDLQTVAAAERLGTALAQARVEANRPFDLQRGPVARALLFRLGEQDHVLLFTIHHIATDGWSNWLLLRELGSLYSAFSRGRPHGLVAPSIHYADYARWQRQWLDEEVVRNQLAYWTKRLLGAPHALDLPTDRPRPPVRDEKGAEHRFELSAELFASLEALAAREGVTMYMLLLSAFAVLLSRQAGTDDVSVGTPIAGRTHSITEDLVGLCVNTLVMRTDLSGDPTFTELLARVKASALDAYSHQDLPFERLVEELRPTRDMSRTPLFQVMFALQNTPRAGSTWSTSRLPSCRISWRRRSSISRWISPRTTEGWWAA